MAQEKGYGEVLGMGIWDGPGNITKKIPSAWDFQFGISNSYFLDSSVVALTR